MKPTATFGFLMTFLCFCALNINLAKAQSNCDTAPATMVPQTEVTLVCPVETTPPPPLADAGDTTLPNLEYVILNNTNKAGGFPRIIGTSASGETILDNLPNLSTGDEVCLVPVRYNLAALQGLVDAIFTGSVGTLTCCGLLNLLLDNACGSINDLGIFAGTDVTNLGDVMSVIEVLDSGNQSIPTWLSAINNVNGQGAILPAACGSPFLPICYALDSAQKVCYQYGLRVGFNIQTVSSISGSDGSATAFIEGVPNTNLNFMWSNGSTANTISNLSSGNYCVTITDVVDDCLGIACVFVPHICSSFMPAYATQNVNCYGQANGFFIVTLDGGIPPYNVQWSDGSTQSVATQGNFASKFNLLPGTYSVTVSDANGCNTSHSTTITQPEPISFTATVSATALSVGETLQTNITNISGGNGNYFTRWQFGDGTFENNSTATHTYTMLGVYNVTATVEDLSACNRQETFSVTVLPATGINEPASAQINVAAFSVSGMLVLQNTQIVNGKAKLILVNTAGQVVWQDTPEFNNGTSTIDLSSLAEGIYLFALQTEAGQGRGKFVLNK